MTDYHEKMKALCEFDTASISNVVATYPGKDKQCLGLYDPWLINWYTDQRIKCMFPKLGPRAGFAVTCVFGLPDPNFKRLGLRDLYKALDASKKPTVLVIKQDMPKKYKDKNGLVGGIMTTTFTKLGCVGLVSDGPSRDLGEVREMDFQFMLTGACAGHGDFSLKAINVPVSVCGMDAAPGEVVHMDENGALKFPADRIDDVIALSRRLLEDETKRMEAIRGAETLDEILTAAAGYGKEK